MLHCTEVQVFAPDRFNVDAFLPLQRSVDIPAPVQVSADGIAPGYFSVDAKCLAPCYSSQMTTAYDNIFDNVDFNCECMNHGFHLAYSQI